MVSSLQCQLREMLPHAHKNGKDSTCCRRNVSRDKTRQLEKGKQTLFSYLCGRTAIAFCLQHEVTSLSPPPFSLSFTQPFSPKFQDQLKEDDVECIVNQDELAMSYQEQSTLPCSPPARLGLDKKASPETPNKENIYEGDLGLGGYELKLEQTPGQSQGN